MTDTELALWVAKYGYFATFAGMLVEGETFLVLSGVAAHRGILSMPVLFAVGAAGAFISDNLFFVTGRVLGRGLITRFPRLAASASRIDALVVRLPNTSVVGVRFLYGMRIVGPAVIGAGTMAWWRFAMLDVLAATLWAVCWISAGYMLGESVELLVERFAGAARWLIPCLVLGAAIATFALRRYRKPRRSSGPVDG